MMFELSKKPLIPVLTNDVRLDDCNWYLNLNRLKSASLEFPNLLNDIIIIKADISRVF